MSRGFPRWSLSYCKSRRRTVNCGFSRLHALNEPLVGFPDSRSAPHNDCGRMIVAND